MSTRTVRAPARRRTSAQAAAVAPVVMTSSTSRTEDGEGRTARNASRSEARRSRPPCPVWAGVSRVLRSSRLQGRPSRRAVSRASSSAWSKPRRARRRRESGTHVTMSAGPEPTSAMAAARERASHPQPRNFSARIASAMGPSYRNGDRAAATARGGQSGQVATAVSVGRPHRAHHGGMRTPTRPAHAPHIGPPSALHAAHRGANSRFSIPARSYVVPPTRQPSGTSSSHGPRTVWPTSCTFSMRRRRR